MSKGSGLGGSSGKSSGATSGNRGKLKSDSTGRRSLSGKAIQGLIAGRGGIAKSVPKVPRNVVEKAKSKYLGLSKSAILIRAQNVTGVKVKISHAYRNQKGGGGDTDIQVTSGADEILAAKEAGAVQILSTVTQVGARGKVTTWYGYVKL